MSSSNQIISKYVQHSKRLANWGQLQWVIISITVLFVIIVYPVEDNIISVLEKIIVWSATLAGITVTGYMGNSSIEKYAEKKFSLISSINCDDSSEILEG